jgi:undecaprenyl diphosphate synthase
MKATPKHIAIIMDGNGRWAQNRMLPRVAGHHRGVEALRAIVQYCVDHQIPILTLFAFSSENWKRPVAEVKLLMSLLQKLLQDEVHQLHSNNVRLRVIGALEGLAPVLQEAIISAQQLTENNSGLQLNIALNYGGRWDIVQATKAICKLVLKQELKIEEINEATLAQHVMLHDLPEPDLLIRSSGEQRISNFLLWQLAYTELYFTNTLWPDFGVVDLESALQFYATRERRYGLVSQESEQAQHV